MQHSRFYHLSMLHTESVVVVLIGDKSISCCR